MTKDEAIKVLKDNNMCVKHGVYLLPPRIDIDFVYYSQKRRYYCPACEDEKRREEVSKIIEAKRVLGIAGDHYL